MTTKIAAVGAAAGWVFTHIKKLSVSYHTWDRNTSIK